MVFLYGKTQKENTLFVFQIDVGCGLFRENSNTYRYESEQRIFEYLWKQGVFVPLIQLLVSTKN